MISTEPISAKTSWHSRLLSGSQVHEVRLDRNNLKIVGGDQKQTTTVPTTSIRRVQISRGVLHNGLSIRFFSRNKIQADGLPKEESERLYLALQEIVESNREREAAEKARELAPRIDDLFSCLNTALSPDRYSRHSSVAEIPEAAATIVEKCDRRTENHLEPPAKKALERLRKVADLQTLEDDRSESNRGFLQRIEPLVQTSTRDILSKGLTQEQAQAIATDEDCTLVLAGAGTGKTAVIIGKIAHLVRNQGVGPSSILALAFNRKAALEIRERLPEDLKDVTVSTFHSFGLRIIADQGVAPTVSKLATDDFAYLKAMNETVEEMLQDEELSKKVLSLIASLPAEYQSPFDFESPAEYEQHIKDAELRTLSGDLVKSFEELTIANFLTANGVEFHYEAPYEIDTATSRYRQYQPDFHIPQNNIYIEHFAINHEGQAPPGWDRYLPDMEWKWQIHALHKTTLVETYSWQHRDGTLLETLKTKLEELGVEFDPVPTEELVKRLSEERISWLAHLLGGFLHHVKSGNLPREEIDRRGQNARDRERTGNFLQVFNSARERYEGMLRTENAIDFHDLINQAAEIIRSNGWENPFTHVLVDEFQDISSGRMALLEALRKDGLAYFLVGDDWQSIYRFAGSQVRLLHDCDQHLGHTERKALTRTFRFGEGILEPSGRFIQQNPEQTERHLTTEREGEGIIVMAARNQQEGLNQAVTEIMERNEGRRPSILVLARYRSRNQLMRTLRTEAPTQLKFSTIHAAKGRESEYVIVLDLVDGRYGFPCMTEDDPLMELVLPPIHGQPFPHAEERRLFYVALTRAVRGAYLIADSRNPSPFVRELLNTSPEVENRGDLAPPCPECPRGSLAPSMSGENLRCSNFPRCGHMTPRCRGCCLGYVTIQDGEGKCSNPVCEAPPQICPRCEDGILIPRSGSTFFWGCSQFHAEPSCRYTTPRDPGARVPRQDTQHRRAPVLRGEDRQVPGSRRGRGKDR